MSDAGRVGRRLQRILLLLPYAINHPGISLHELAVRFDISPGDLKKDLDLLFLCGLPGYTPGDLIDIDLSGDRVYVRMADYFSAPLRLTSREALSLYAAGSAIASLPGMEKADPLRRALVKLGRAMGADAGGAAVDVELDTGHEEHLEILQEALRSQRRIAMEYFSASRDEMTSREVDPWGLVAALGRWYLVGLDHLSGEERMFRVDRVKSLRMLDVAAPSPPDFDPGAYRSAWRDRGRGGALILELSPGVARWFPDYYPLRSATTTADGSMRAELTSSGDRWAAALVLRLGPGVRSVEPTVVRETAAELAARIVERHAGTGS